MNILNWSTVATIAGLAAEYALRWLLNRLETDKEKQRLRDVANKALIEAKKAKDPTLITLARVRLKNLR